jgi:hypothetical protein
LTPGRAKTGGELFDLIVERGHLSERDAAVNARAILEVIRHCHSKCAPFSCA